MKKLFICRHAKSSWSFDLDDVDRPLGNRGRRDVLRVGQYLRDYQIKKPDLILTSPASRAFYTALFLADHWEYKEDKIMLEQRLYHGTSDTITQLLSEQADHESIAIFGHNPGFSELTYHLSGGKTDEMPTGSIVGLEFPVSNWSSIGHTNGKIFFSIYPKKL